MTAANTQDVLTQMGFRDEEHIVKEKYIVNPGETPWWEIDDLEERRKTYTRQSARMWRKLHPGAKTEAQRRYTVRHPGAKAEATRRHREKYPNSASETRRRYYKTPQGRVYLARIRAKRRERSTDPEAYAARVELLHTIQESCAKCGAPYKITFQIDHIVPLCIGGTDDWDNLQPLCVLCHRKKTGKDMDKFASTVLRQSNIEEKTDHLRESLGVPRVGG